MKKLAIITAAALVPLLAGCAPTGMILPVIPGTCPAGQLQGFVGQNETAITDINYAGPTRVIRPGDMVTMDLIPIRLNIRINTNQRIASITCG